MTRPSRDYTCIPVQVLDAPLSAYAKLAYWVLARHTDDADSAFPGIARIAEEMSTAKGTAIKAIDELVALGLVLRRHRGQGRTNAYTVRRDEAIWPAIGVSGFRQVESTEGSGVHEEECRVAESSRPRSRRGGHLQSATRAARIPPHGMELDPLELDPSGSLQAAAATDHSDQYTVREPAAAAKGNPPEEFPETPPPPRLPASLRATFVDQVRRAPTEREVATLLQLGEDCSARGRPELLAAAIAHTARSDCRSFPAYLRRVVTDCLADGSMPGATRDRGGTGSGSGPGGVGPGASARRGTGWEDTEELSEEQIIALEQAQWQRNQQVIADWRRENPHYHAAAGVAEVRR